MTPDDVSSAVIRRRIFTADDAGCRRMSADVASSARMTWRMTADDEALSLRDVIRTSSAVIGPDDGGCRVIRTSSAVIRRQPGPAGVQ
jgi:hypothetical protein